MAEKFREDSYPEGLEGAIAAPNSHRPIFERGSVRIVEVSIAPGVQEPIHTHEPAAMLVSLTDTALRYRKYSWEAGQWVMLESRDGHSQSGKTNWFEGEPPHSVENLDSEAYRGIRIEFLDQPGRLTW